MTENQEQEIFDGFYNTLKISWLAATNMAKGSLRLTSFLTNIADHNHSAKVVLYYIL